METTLQIDDRVLAQAQEYAAAVDRSLSEVVADALKEKLARWGRPPQPGVRPPANPSLHPDIQRISGLVRKDIDVKSLYREHILTRQQ
jgi:hypothetical protein